jgi:N6-adenosine-specific RNA methylase IME4
VSQINPLPDGPYDIVYADPPWAYYGSGEKDAAAGKHYEMLDQDDLASLDVRGVMARNAALFLWATGPRLNFAIDLIERWGLHYRGVAFVWVKTDLRGGIIGGQGVPPTFTKPTTEFILSATTKPTGRPFPINDAGMPQVVLHHRLEHSRKPDVFRNLITSLCRAERRLEMFARESRPGWDVWGNQVEKFVEARVPLFEPAPVVTTVDDTGARVQMALPITTLPFVEAESEMAS